MNLYILTPFNPKWPAAQFKRLDAVIVRAANEAKARDLVKAVTFNSDRSKIGVQVQNPWQNRSFSKCEVYRGSDFSKEGKPEVLAPDNLRDYFQKMNQK